MLCNSPHTIEQKRCVINVHTALLEIIVIISNRVIPRSGIRMSNWVEEMTILLAVSLQGSHSARVASERNMPGAPLAREATRQQHMSQRQLASLQRENW